MVTTVPYASPSNVILPFNPALGGAAYYDPSGKLVIKPLSNFNLSKAIGDMLKAFKDFMVKEVMPVLVGVMTIILLIMGIGYTLR